MARVLLFLIKSIAIFVEINSNKERPEVTEDRINVAVVYVLLFVTTIWIAKKCGIFHISKDFCICCGHWRRLQFILCRRNVNVVQCALKEQINDKKCNLILYFPSSFFFCFPFLFVALCGEGSQMSKRTKLEKSKQPNVSRFGGHIGATECWLHIFRDIDK